MEEQSDLRPCPKCGRKIPLQAAMCSFCDSLVGESPTISARIEPAARQQYYPGTAAVLSFFIPGLGQLYEQRLQAFVLLFVLYIALGTLMLFAGGTAFVMIAIGLFVVWALGIYDALYRIM